MDKRKESLGILIQYTVQFFCVAFFFCLVVRTTIVASESMEPALMTGDIALYNRCAYIFADVNRGDIICYWSEERDSLMSKRAIGIEGDIIEFYDGRVFINGCCTDESAYLEEDVYTYGRGKFIVPKDCVFVLGDNRENSWDSRIFPEPYIPVDRIVGKYMGNIPSFW